MNKQNILVVDDYWENLIVMEVLLEVEDCNLVMVGFGNEVLVLVFKYDFVLVLFDVQMFEMDGFEVVQLMCQNCKIWYIFIIFVIVIFKE